ncbi:TPA: hypothetical protein PPN70_001437 [Serratia rubidaea]|nr:hypothetical protein [Serratia rubidaea]HDJ1448077.1 hypothetical protein [Serratia rubidaea]HDJ1462892.1 hypothetical protein [Serratia rubidaea]HDJ2773338.1 hypothetical protein [Serratia rubidaea]
MIDYPPAVQKTRTSGAQALSKKGAEDAYLSGIHALTDRYPPIYAAHFSALFIN